MARQLIRDCLELPRGQRPADAGLFLQRLRQLPLTLGADAELAQLRQEANHVATRHNKPKPHNSPNSYKFNSNKRTTYASNKPRGCNPSRKPLPLTAQPSGQLAEQWRELQDLVAPLATIPPTFAQERSQEQQRIKQMQAKALQELGEFHSEPRDEEFEYQSEYATRLAQEQAAYAAQRQAILDLWNRTKQATIARINFAEQAALEDNRQATGQATSTTPSVPLQHAHRLAL